MSLDARTCTLEEVLFAPKSLKVARFQRHYEWSLLEIEQLLDDLIRAFRASLSSKEDENKEYFIGSFIFQSISQPSKPDFIIDGQQRLVSFSILFAVIRDLISDPEQKNEIDKTLTVPKSSLSDKKPQQRLTLGRYDNALFLKSVVNLGATYNVSSQEKPKGGVELRFYENSLRIQEWVKSELAEEELPIFVTYLLKWCAVILITVDEGDDAFRIFETINARGRPLQPADILRSTLIDFAAEDNEKEHQKLLVQWDRMERRIKHGRMKRFINQLHMKRTLNQKNVGKYIDRDILSSFDTPQAALSFLQNDIDNEASYFVKVISRFFNQKEIDDKDLRSQINHRLRSMRLVDFDDWIPIAIFILRKYQDAHQDMLVLLFLLDRLVWLFFLKHDEKKITENRRKRFDRILTDFVEEKDLSAIKNSMNLTSKEKAQMRNKLFEKIDPKWIPLKKLLIRIEYTTNPRRRTPDLSSYTIEHILPLTPEHKSWFDLYGSMSAVNEYSRMLGNLCLVTEEINVMLGSKSYTRKKEIIKDHEAWKDGNMVRDFATKNEWPKEVISERTKSYANLLIKEFGLSN